MSARVFANGMEVSAKKSGNKSIAAMPDVCLSPPSPPAGPLPLPYPNFSQASDTADGTKSVKLAGQEAGIKDSSNYSTSKGDEAATRSFGMGTVTHTIQGTTKFAAWSMDVKFEGSNVTRFGDITTHNHSNPANSADTTTSVGEPDTSAVPKTECEELDDRLNEAEANDTVGGAIPDDQVMATANASPDLKLKAASSDAFIKPAALSGYCPRPWDPVDGEPVEPKVACSQDRYNSSRGGGGHAEGRVIQRVFATNPPPGSTLTFRIKWVTGNGKTRQMPCKDCKGAICKAAIECGWNIQFCVKKGDKVQKQKAPCKKNKTTGKAYWKKDKNSPLKGIL